MPASSWQAERRSTRSCGRNTGPGSRSNETRPPEVRDTSWPRRRHRPLRPGQAGSERASSRSRDADKLDADSPGDLRPDRPAADARGDRRLRQRQLAGGLREGRGSPAGLAGLRRTLGPALAGRGPLRRIDRARRATSRIPHAWRYRDYVIDAFNARQAVRPVHPRADRRRPAARELAQRNATNS